MLGGRSGPGGADGGLLELKLMFGLFGDCCLPGGQLPEMLGEHVGCSLWLSLAEAGGDLVWLLVVFNWNLQPILVVVLLDGGG
ncbi:hypothetical protein QQ045_003372 [Rhodiola kirilowii]